MDKLIMLQDKITMFVTNLVKTYITNWKRGFYCSLYLGVVLFLSFLSGYLVYVLSQVVFGFEPNKLFRDFCILAFSPAYLGGGVDKLKNGLANL